MSVLQQPECQEVVTLFPLVKNRTKMLQNPLNSRLRFFLDLQSCAKPLGHEHVHA